MHIGSAGFPARYQGQPWPGLVFLLSVPRLLRAVPEHWQRCGGAAGGCRSSCHARHPAVHIVIVGFRTDAAGAVYDPGAHLMAT